MTDTTSARPATRRTASADAAAAARDRRRAGVLAGALTVAVVLLVVVGWQTARITTARDLHRSRDELRSTAGTIVAQVLSYQGRTLAADRSRARALVTDDYATRVGFGTPPVLSTDTGVTWKAGEVAVVDADATSGTALIDGTITRTSVAGPQSSAQTLTAAFVRSDGRWLVDRIEVVR